MDTEKKEVETVSSESGVNYEELAGEIYDLDEKVYNILGSSLGRVFSESRERTVRRLVDEMDVGPEENIVLVRKRVALIGNMARTIPDHAEKSEVMTQYNDIMQKLVRITAGFVDGSLLDRNRARLNTLTLGGRFAGKSHLVICISRSYGSGGNNIGFGLADKLKINYYDAEIFQDVLRRMEAEKDGIPDSGVFPGIPDPKIDRKNPGMTSYEDHVSLRERLSRLNRYHGLPARDAVFFNQSDLIADLAEKQDFVVMGRCADTVLKNRNIPHISIFITAPFARRVQRMMELNHVDARRAAKQLKAVDHEHAAYYQYYTGLKWGDANHYDLCINSSSYGIQGSIDFIVNVLKVNKVKLPHRIDE